MALVWQGAIRSADPSRLLTVGHNAQHALLHSNALLDFVSHHSYPSNPKTNISCTFASFANVTAMPGTLAKLQELWSERPRPLTIGEFGTKTTAGLWPLFRDPVGAPDRSSGGDGAAGAEGCAMLSFSASALWDSLTFLQSLASGLDGALKWALFEKGWVVDVLTNTWTPDTGAGLVKHVAGGRWGFHYYTPESCSGRPKPIVHVTRALAEYLTSSSTWRSGAASLRLETWAVPLPADAAAAARAVPAAFRFVGSDVLAVGAQTFENASTPALSFSAAVPSDGWVGGGPGVVVAFWSIEPAQPRQSLAPL